MFNDVAVAARRPAARGPLHRASRSSTATCTRATAPPRSSATIPPSSPSRCTARRTTRSARRRATSTWSCPTATGDDDYLAALSAAPAGGVRPAAAGAGVLPGRRRSVRGRSARPAPGVDGRPRGARRRWSSTPAGPRARAGGGGDERRLRARRGRHRRHPPAHGARRGGAGAGPGRAARRRECARIGAGPACRSASACSPNSTSPRSCPSAISSPRWRRRWRGSRPARCSSRCGRCWRWGRRRRIFGVMPAYVAEPPQLGAKLVTVFGDNLAKGLPSHLATILLLRSRHRRADGGDGRALHHRGADGGRVGGVGQGAGARRRIAGWRSSAPACRRAAISRRCARCGRSATCACGARRRGSRERFVADMAGRVAVPVRAVRLGRGGGARRRYRGARHLVADAGHRRRLGGAGRARDLGGRLPARPARDGARARRPRAPVRRLARRGAGRVGRRRAGHRARDASRRRTSPASWARWCSAGSPGAAAATR